LDYWIAANRRAIEFGSQHLGEDFLLVNYDQFCANPEADIIKLCQFLGLASDPSELTKFVALVKPTTIDRYKNTDLPNYSKSQITAVRKLGFAV